MTPWGAAINFDGADSGTVREFFIHNALYWLEEYHFDGLRLDAIHAVHDASEPHIVSELARRGARGGRAALARSISRSRTSTTPRAFSAPPALAEHLRCAVERRRAPLPARAADRRDPAVTTPTTRDDPHALLCRALAEGLRLPGRAVALRRRGRAASAARTCRRAPSSISCRTTTRSAIAPAASASTALVRDAAALRAASAVLLLAPAPPLLFMGEEWAAAEPFPWFCDFEPQLAARGARRPRARVSRAAPTRALRRPTLAAQLDWRRRRDEPAGTRAASLPAAARDPPPRHRAAHSAARRRPRCASPAARRWQSLERATRAGAAPARQSQRRARAAAGASRRARDLRHPSGRTRHAGARASSRRGASCGCWSSVRP